MLEFLPPVLTTAVTYLLRGLFFYGLTIFLVPLPAVFQEYKIWNKYGSPHVPPLSPLGCLKVYLLNVLWMGLTYSGALLLLPKLVLCGFDRSAIERDAHCLVERIAAVVCISTVVGPVVVRGSENLPPDSVGGSSGGSGSGGGGGAAASSPAPVYIANHASQIDVGAVYFLFRRFKWIAKKSVLFLPGVGQIMYLGGHVFIQRKGKNRGSIASLYEKSKGAVEGGVPMFIFPQGTRRMVQRLPFKDGAFNIAVESGCLVVPVSIEIPKGAWNGWYPLNMLWGAKKDPIILTVHKPIQTTKDMDKTKLKEKCYDTIYSVLPKYGDEQDEKKQS